MRLKSLPHALHNQANRIRFFLGCLFLKIAEWVELHGRLPARGAVFLVIVAGFTACLFAGLPAHPLRFTVALGLGLAAGVIVRSFELVLQRKC